MGPAFVWCGLPAQPGSVYARTNGKSLLFGVFEDLFVGADDELHPLLGGLGGADLPVRDVGGDEAQQPLQQDVGAVVYVVLL